MSIRERALNLLATREYGFNELVAKLNRTSGDSEAVFATVESLCKNGLQSDRRFVESYLASRAERGYGPIRIKAELAQKGVDDDLIDALVAAADERWDAAAATAREKKYGARSPADYRDKMKQSRFLHYRGFTHDQIKRAFKSDA